MLSPLGMTKKPGECGTCTWTGRTAKSWVSDLCALVDCITWPCADVESSVTFPLSFPPPDLFVGQLKSSMTCTVCDFRSTMFDPFWDLSIPVPQVRRWPQPVVSLSHTHTSLHPYLSSKLSCKTQCLEHPLVAALLHRL